MNEIHRLNYCGKDKFPIVCIECAYDEAVIEDSLWKLFRRLKA